MATAVLLPKLTDWVQNHITAIIEAKTTHDLHDAVNRFLNQHAMITVNGAHISRAEFVKQLKAENFAEEKATITFNDSIEVPDSREGESITAGTVGVFYTAIITSAHLIHGIPTSKQVIASLNVVVAPDPSVHKPPMPNGYYDPRRVTSLNEVRVERPLKLTPSGTSAPATAEACC
ncbi:hypothetical protein BDN70DRAFT_881837 [Pholiota conissans]|uniref:Uncharacterized protein n=1 Tax=Pholiota conissans TaxID=109636 RepID=A0A9P5YZV5_9AGAR|nr:hypothetical protein BDN70DRAFT_881837 [Pholiota conissans]